MQVAAALKPHTTPHRCTLTHTHICTLARPPRLSYSCLPQDECCHFFDLVQIVLLLTFCPSVPLSEDAPMWFRRIVAAARDHSSDHRSSPCPNFFDFLRQAESPWLWWQPSLWPVAGELSSLLLLPPPSSSQRGRQDLILVTPHLFFGVACDLLGSGTALQVPLRSVRVSAHT
jgi:hypothetical protein